MNREAYVLMYETELRHWWYRAKRDILLSMINSFITKSSCFDISIADVGCGTGAMLEQLAMQYGELNVCGLDYSNDALEYCRKRFNGTLVNINLEFPDNSQSELYDCLISSDVLEHINNHNVAVQNLNKLLSKNGLVFITVPAFQFLWSTHDVWLGHKRRYTKRQLRQVLEDNGFRVEFISYYNFFLFPIMIFVRFFENLYGKKNDANIEDKIPVSIINGLLHRIFSLEKYFLINNIQFPFGGSIICVAIKV